MADEAEYALPNEQEILRRTVGGVTAFVMDFDGPCCAHIGATPYFTLQSCGETEEGAKRELYPWKEAIERYAKELAFQIGKHKDLQIAWRCRPSLETDGPGRCSVYSRLAFI